MSKTYYCTNTALANGFRTAITENSMEQTTGSATTASATIPSGSTGVQTFVFSTTAGEPNDAAWPSSTSGYAAQIEINSLGADITLSGTCFLWRADSTLSTGLEASPSLSWDSTSGTGIKSATLGVAWTPTAGSTSDRFVLDIRASNGSHMTDEALVLNVNGTTSYAIGPWTAGGTTYNKTGSGVLI